MDLTVETIALSAVFLLPGYAAHRLTGYFSRKPEREPSTFDATLTSLGLTIGILLAEAAIATAIAAVVFFTKRAWLDSLDLAVLVRSGLRVYATAHPWEIVLTILAVASVTALGAFLLGLKDPVGERLERRQLRRNVSPFDMWTLAFDAKRVSYRHTNLSIKVKGSGDVFQGRVESWSLPRDKTGSRDIYMRHVTYTPGATGKPIHYAANNSPRSGAIISSETIESITILYE